MLAVSMAAQTGTLGFSLFHFGQFPLSFLLSTLIVIPLAPFIIFLLLSTMGISIFSFEVAQLLAHLTDWTISTQNNILGIISNQDILYLNHIPFSNFDLIGYYTLLISFNMIRRLYNWNTLFCLLLISASESVKDYQNLSVLETTMYKEGKHYILESNFFGVAGKNRLEHPEGETIKLVDVDYCIRHKKSP